MNENYADRFFMPGETVWYKKEKCIVLKCHKDNKFSVVPKTGPNRNRETIVPADQLGVYTELERVKDEISELDTEFDRLMITRLKLEKRRAKLTGDKINEEKTNHS